MRTISKKKLAVSGAIAVILVGSSTAAYAYWTSQGTGTGSATTSAGAANLRLDQVGSITNLFPGDQPQDLVVKVTNLAENNAYVAAVSGKATVTKAIGAPAGTCDASNYQVNGGQLAGTGEFTLTWAAVDLAKDGDQSTAGDTFHFFNKSGTNQDACKGASIAFDFAAN